MSKEVGGTATEWLFYLDNLKPDDSLWRDTEFVWLTSWVMLMFIPRRLGEILIINGFAEDAREIRFKIDAG